MKIEEINHRNVNVHTSATEEEAKAEKEHQNIIRRINDIILQTQKMIRHTIESTMRDNEVDHTTSIKEDIHHLIQVVKDIDQEKSLVKSRVKVKVRRIHHQNGTTIHQMMSDIIRENIREVSIIVIGLNIIKNHFITF